MPPRAGPPGRNTGAGWTSIHHGEPGCPSAQPIQSIIWSNRIVGQDRDLRGKHTLHFLERMGSAGEAKGAAAAVAAGTGILISSHQALCIPGGHHPSLPLLPSPAALGKHRHFLDIFPPANKEPLSSFICSFLLSFVRSFIHSTLSEHTSLLTWVTLRKRL